MQAFFWYSEVGDQILSAGNEIIFKIKIIAQDSY